ncbi:glycosyltransferase [Novosphingobium resinovorum]|uniref:glycosyltransferase n=1 Tax=Novosphingobium TaxID=165696 RepID=UPI001B3C6104|nr:MULTISPECIES: glycosyltransferase [Novosphingobium]MBF7012795.1 glycosyltransferase [Novosphingobium sp. HR1a]WJM27532.1 glycosyltransferase [Novosphingobium resinovorum]
MTRILRIIASAELHGGGPIEGARRFAEVWASDGHRQDLLTLDPPESNPLPDYPGEVFRIGPPHGRSLLQRYRYAPGMISWLKENASRYDAVIVSGLWRYFARGAMKGLARGPVPYFVFTHGMLDPWFKRTAPLKNWGKQISWLWAEGPLLRHATNVLFTTEEEKLLAEGAFWPYYVKGQVVGYGTSDVTGDPATQISAFRSLLPALGSRRFLLFLSRIHPKKGCDLLIEAFATIAAANPSLDLVIAGPDQAGLVNDLRSRTIELGVEERIHFSGMLKGDVKTGAFRAAEAFVLPSHQENFGIVVAEAMACGTPVLISNKVNIWREVVADHAGLVEDDTVEGTKALLNHFIALTSDEQKAMGDAARASFLTRFHVVQAARNLLSHIQQKIDASTS